MANHTPNGRGSGDCVSVRNKMCPKLGQNGPGGLAASQAPDFRFQRCRSRLGSGHPFLGRCASGPLVAHRRRPPSQDARGEVRAGRCPGRPRRDTARRRRSSRRWRRGGVAPVAREEPVRRENLVRPALAVRHQGTSRLQAAARAIRSAASADVGRKPSTRESRSPRSGWVSRDFGPTFASQKLLAEYGHRLSAETLRGWMTEDGLWRPKARRELREHPSRPRRECVGDLVQIDGSPHDWFENRGRGARGRERKLRVRRERKHHASSGPRPWGRHAA